MLLPLCEQVEERPVPAERGAQQLGVRPDLASIVLHVADRNAWHSAATAGWLVAENDGLQQMEPGRPEGNEFCVIRPKVTLTQ